MRCFFLLCIIGTLKVDLRYKAEMGVIKIELNLKLGEDAVEWRLEADLNSLGNV